jgi:hypothetical protein
MDTIIPMHVIFSQLTTCLCCLLRSTFSLRIKNIQRHLAAVIPREDQILLLGPPYKVPKDHSIRSNDTLSALRVGDLEDDPTYVDVCVSVHENVNVSENENVEADKDAHTTAMNPRKPILGTTEKTGSRRLFLFSKQALSDSAPDPLPCVLTPLDVELPTAPDPSPITYNDSTIPSSPLHQALSIYERRFMLHLCQGRAYADAADLRLESARNCILEQAVMVRALRAAVSNLSDHWNAATRTRAEFTAFYMEKNDEHGKILNGLEGTLEELSEISLHQELKTIARVNGRVMETLLDTVPVEREKRWASQCQTSYSRLQGLFEELQGEFENLISTSNREEEARSDLEAEELVKSLGKEVEDAMVQLRDIQAERMDRLTNDHIEVVSVVVNAVQDEQRVQAAFTTLESKSKASTAILPSMQSDDLKLKEVMVKVADAKTAAMRRMNVRLRQISQAQLKIQRLLKGVSGLRAALVQQCEDMTHIEHLFELTAAYRSFISEIRRRRSYGDAVGAISNAMFERLATMRNDEVKSREKFLRGPGRHLMPSFYDILVPTLATQPPLFTPQLPAMVEIDSLPNFGDGDASMGAEKDVQNPVQGNESGGEENVASSLTESRTEADDAEGISSLSRLSVSKDDGAPDSPLIVSTEGQSGGDVIMNSQNEVGKMEQEAENKYLAYENAILRQKMEELSAKSPQPFIDEAKEKETTSSLQEELEITKKELGQTKSLLYQSRTAPAGGEEKDCDKISHSSFEVGDVALFMPTGRGSGGKRTYLAFHSNCAHRYLSSDSIEGNPDYVLGRIVYQEELVAGPVGTDENPHGLKVSTKFWILTVEALKVH